MRKETKTIETLRNEHAIKLECLPELSLDKANEMIEAFKDIASYWDFSDDRIENIECRARSGFSPYSHNKGGISAYAYIGNSTLSGGGYDYGDNVIERAIQYNVDSFKEDYPKEYSTLETYWSNDAEETEKITELLDMYYEYIDGCSDYDCTQFQLRFLVLEDSTVDVDVFGSTMDAPYFRKSDYNKNKNFEFKDVESFKEQVNDFLATCDCIDLIREYY